MVVGFLGSGNFKRSCKDRRNEGDPRLKIRASNMLVTSLFFNPSNRVGGIGPISDSKRMLRKYGSGSVIVAGKALRIRFRSWVHRGGIASQSEK